MSSLALTWPLAGSKRRAGSRTAPTMDSTSTDIDLVLAIGRQDREAFRLFYDRYAGRILAYVRQLSREREVAEDVVQDVFLAVWRKAASYRPDRGDVPGWLYTITRNRLVDRWRRKGGQVEDDDFDLGRLEAPERGQQAEIEDDDFDLGRLEAPERGQQGHVVDLAVRQALGALSREQREAVELAYFGGLTYEETAARLDLPLGTLKSRIRAGLARMRGVLSTSEAG